MRRRWWPRPRVLSRLALLYATVIWGCSFVIVQRALADIPVFHLLAYRFTLSTLLLAPFAWRGGGWTRALRRDGILIGVVLFAGFALQTSGLQWTTPSRSAFLTGLSVVLVPILAVLLGRRLQPGPMAGALCAGLGLWVLYRPAAGAVAGAPLFNRGDALTMAGAVVFAAFVLLVERAVRRHRLAPLALVQFGVIAVLSLPSLLFSPPDARELSGYPLFAVLVTGVLATAAAFGCQLYAQRHLTAIEAGVILALEPVVAAAASVLVGAERVTVALAMGGILVVAAMLVTELWGGPDDAAPPVAATPRS